MLRAAPAAVLGAVSLVLGTATAAGGPAWHRESASTTASPPVITEDFKPVLPCNANTTVGMEGCVERKDRELNADVKVILNLTSGATRHDFVVAQTKWLVYRNADCRSYSDIARGGTEQPVDYGYCLAADDAARRQELKDFFRGLTQGRPRVPTFP